MLTQVSMSYFLAFVSKYPCQEEPFNFYNVVKCGVKMCFKKNIQATFYMLDLKKITSIMTFYYRVLTITLAYYILV